MADQLERIKVSVNTLARPARSGLLAARTVVQNTPEVQALFLEARERGASSESLADVLHVVMPDHLEGDWSSEEIWDICLYLADEYTQLGSCMLLVSSETGQAIARVSDDDIYLPQPVQRQDGSLAQPLPRLKPELEGQIVQWQFDEHRDQKVLVDLQAKVARLGLFDDGKVQLLKATKRGRRELADRVRTELSGILSELIGLPGRFAAFCQVVEQVPEYAKGWHRVEFETLATVVTQVSDPYSLNLCFNPHTILKRQIGCQWIRSLAELAALQATGDPIPLTLAESAKVSSGVWVAEPHVAMLVRGLAVPGVPTARAYLSPLIYLEAPIYDSQSRELLDRWEVAAKLQCAVYINLDGIQLYNFTDLPEEDPYTEVVS